MLSKLQCAIKPVPNHCLNVPAVLSPPFLLSRKMYFTAQPAEKMFILSLNAHDQLDITGQCCRGKWEEKGFLVATGIRVNTPAPLARSTEQNQSSLLKHSTNNYWNNSLMVLWLRIWSACQLWEPGLDLWFRKIPQAMEQLSLCTTITKACMP